MTLSFKHKLSATLLVLATSIYSQTAELKTEIFKVYGNCGMMCKGKIEGALEGNAGVTKKEWTVDTKMLEVTYDPSKISLTEIKQKVADVGYDSEEIRAKDSTYNNLHSCCKYKRPESKKSKSKK